MSRQRLTVLVAGVAMAAVVAAALGAGRSGAHGRTRGRAFVVTGGVAGLYPGGTRRLVVRIRNRRHFPIRVVALRVRVRGAGGCGSRYVHVGRLGRRPLVPPFRRRRVALRVTMARNAPAACEGARFRLFFRGRGIRP
jgi:hypothetical protein